MTRTTNARLAGFTFLCYIAIGITTMVLFHQVTLGLWLLIKGVAPIKRGPVSADA